MQNPEQSDIIAPPVRQRVKEAERSNMKDEHIKRALIMIAVVLMILAIPGMLAVGRASAQSSTPTQGATQPEIDLLKIISIASGAVTGITVVVGALAATIKSFRAWMVKLLRKALHIADIEKVMKENADQQKADLERSTEERKSQLKVLTTQNAALEADIKKLIDTIDGLNETMIKSQVVDKAMIKDSITRIYYKYHRRKQIPINVRENAFHLLEVYDSLHGNSFVHDLVDQMKTWQIIYAKVDTEDSE